MKEAGRKQEKEKILKSKKKKTNSLGSISVFYSIKMDSWEDFARLSLDIDVRLKEMK